MSTFANLRIVGKIAAGYGLAIAALIAVSGITILGLAGAGGKFAEFSRLAGETNHFSQIQASLLEARLGMETYLATQSKDSMTLAVEKLKATAGLAEEAKLESLLHLLEMCDAKFSLLVKNQEDFDRAMAQLDGAAAEVEAALPPSALPARQSFLKAKLAVAAYLRTHSEDEVDALQDQAAAFKSQTGPAADKFKRYMAVFDDLHEALMARDDYVHIVRDQAGPEGSKEIAELLQAVKQAQDRLGSSARGTIRLIIAIASAAALSAIAVAVLSALVIGRGISRPVVELTGLMRRLAERDFTIDPGRFTARRDEVGQMALTLDHFRAGMEQADRLAAEREAQREAESARARHIDELARAFKAEVAEVLDGVALSAQALTDTSGVMSRTANHAAERAATVSTAADRASENVQTVVAATEQMASSIGEIGRRTADAHAITAEAGQESDRANADIGQLAEAAERISAVVELISRIASQTNMLALNATIEAARAGETGKGFAVVANEVKHLANQTRKATEDISAQVGNVQLSTEHAVRAVGKIGETVWRIHEISSAIAAAVEEQGVATQSIALNIHQAGDGTRAVTENVAGVAGDARYAGEAAAKVLAEAATLNGQSRLLREIVGRFISEVAA